MYFKVFFILVCATVHVLASVPLQLEKEEPLYAERVSRAESPRYVMPDYRLPIQFIPSHYTVNLRPILDDDIPDQQFTAPGNVSIEVNCIENTKTITLHSYTIDIQYDSIFVLDVDANIILRPIGVSNATVNHTYTIQMEDELIRNKNYTIFIEFTSVIGGAAQLFGIYYRTYKDPVTQQDKYVVLTKLEAIGTRMVFPCFDEPALKATYDMRLAHTSQYNTLCNMPKIRENVTDESLPGWSWDYYDTTVTMSTYLLAFVISDFISADATPGLYNKPVKTWGAPHLISRGGGEYGANETAKILAFFEERYDMEYALPKMDSAAIPNFSSGAMEQWGMITYRDDLLLYFEGESTETERRRISQIVAHELAHQWFGNTVTLAWWDNLWLNEGFANYVEKFGLKETVPEFEPDDLIVSADMNSAFTRDAQNNSLPVHYDGDNLSAIVYNKAACLIRMMVAFLTQNTFQPAVNQYLKSYQWGNAIQDNLFEILTAQAHEDGTLSRNISVKAIMDTWTRQTGFPIIKIFRASNSRIFISQERFGRAVPMVDTEVLDPNEYWYVPISYVTAADPVFDERNQVPKLWLAKNEVLRNHDVDTTRWILVNTDARAFYRVLYDNPLHTLIVEQLLTDPKVFSDASRTQLVDDSFKAYFEEYTDVSYPMSITRYLHLEDKLVVWTSFFNNFRTTYTHLSSHSSYGRFFTEYFAEKIEDALEKIGAEQSAGERGNSVLLRALLLDWACGMNLTICNDYANKLFTVWKADPDSKSVVPVDIKAIMYCAIVNSAVDSTEKYNFFLAKYEQETVAAQRNFYRNALACVSDADLITRLLTETGLQSGGNDTAISKSDSVEIIKRLMINPNTRGIAVDFMFANLNGIITNHGLNAVRDIIVSLSSVVNENADKELLVSLISDNSDTLEPVRPALDAAIVTIDTNIRWMGNFGNRLGNWIQDAVNAVGMP